MKDTEKKQFLAAMYIRLSRENEEKVESNSVTNQKNMILQYALKKPEINIILEAIDDGYSGVDFERPAFLKMIELIKKGNINCVIVKDLSRLGRNYIEVGKYIERFFPFYNVRFIAINDNYDSDALHNQTDSILLPFKNLINDAYSLDISVKTKSHLNVKRKNGDFIGAFASFGYLKSRENKNQLVVDEFAASVVRDIFKWKLLGRSNSIIADKLNSMGILSPMEYKLSLGLNYHTGFKKNDKALWSARSVRRILSNELYLGTMVQGKEYIPIYRQKKKVLKEEEEWVRVPNKHEPIISEVDFLNVKRLDRFDTRVAPGNEYLYDFGGILRCGDCRETMVRIKKTNSNKTNSNKTNNKIMANTKQTNCKIKTSTKKMDTNKLKKIEPNNGELDDKTDEIKRNDPKTYVYYICSSYKHNRNCSYHSISEKSLRLAIDTTIRLLFALQDWQAVGFGGPNNRNLYVHFIENIYVYEGGRISIEFRFDEIEL